MATKSVDSKKRNTGSKCSRTAMLREEINQQLDAMQGEMREMLREMKKQMQDLISRQVKVKRAQALEDHLEVERVRFSNTKFASCKGSSVVADDGSNYSENSVFKDEETKNQAMLYPANIKRPLKEDHHARYHSPPQATLDQVSTRAQHSLESLSDANILKSHAKEVFPETFREVVARDNDRMDFRHDKLTKQEKFDFATENSILIKEQRCFLPCDLARKKKENASSEREISTEFDVYTLEVEEIIEDEKSQPINWLASHDVIPSIDVDGLIAAKEKLELREMVLGDVKKISGSESLTYQDGQEMDTLMKIIEGLDRSELQYSCRVMDEKMPEVYIDLKSFVPYHVYNFVRMNSDQLHINCLALSHLMSTMLFHNRWWDHKYFRKKCMIKDELEHGRHATQLFEEIHMGPIPSWLAVIKVFVSRGYLRGTLQRTARRKLEVCKDIVVTQCINEVELSRLEDQFDSVSGYLHLGVQPYIGRECNGINNATKVKLKLLMLYQWDPGGTAAEAIETRLQVDGFLVQRSFERFSYRSDHSNKSVGIEMLFLYVVHENKKELVGASCMQRNLGRVHDVLKFGALEVGSYMSEEIWKLWHIREFFTMMRSWSISFREGRTGVQVITVTVIIDEHSELRYPIGEERNNSLKPAKEINFFHDNQLACSQLIFCSTPVQASEVSIDNLYRWLYLLYISIEGRCITLSVRDTYSATTVQKFWLAGINKGKQEHIESQRNSNFWEMQLVSLFLGVISLQSENVTEFMQVQFVQLEGLPHSYNSFVWDPGGSCCRQTYLIFK